ncbi:hypothetical protein HPB47_007479 [Ixodes persulcatus]|uniref:Uncharacterized protein n=1 Tax=Ixodes persulcatus TaxID=34615 RepID=A0AC60P7E6_IXOPE|nr:hypothetical protein HPB47_007479 [Ixodes persulcatus]
MAQELLAKIAGMPVARRNLLFSFLENEPAVEPKGRNLTFGAIFPDTSLLSQQRKYQQKLRDGMSLMTKGRTSGLRFMQLFSVQAKAVRMSLQPTPKDILRRLCEDLLPDDVVAVLYLTNSAVFGSNAASVQYVLQLLGYLGVPVIAWNADNIGLDQQTAFVKWRQLLLASRGGTVRASIHSAFVAMVTARKADVRKNAAAQRYQRVSQARVLQLAPSVVHQVAAIFAILERYAWYQFAVVTTQLGGHEDFVRAVRDRQLESSGLRAKFSVLAVYTLRGHTRQEFRSQLEPVATGEARVLLLFASKEDSREVFAAVSQLGMTSKNYVWIVTQSVIGAHPGLAPPEYPAGLLVAVEKPTTATTRVLAKKMRELQSSSRCHVLFLPKMAEGNSKDRMTSYNEITKAFRLARRTLPPQSDKLDRAQAVALRQLQTRTYPKG